MARREVQAERPFLRVEWRGQGSTAVFRVTGKTLATGLATVTTVAGVIWEVIRHLR
jgi:hypothetical protein